MTDTVTNDETNTCRFCEAKIEPGFLSVCNVCLDNTFESGTGSALDISKLLGMSPKILGELEKAGRLDPEYLDSDSESLNEQTKRYSRQVVIKYAKESPVCKRCRSNHVFRDIYCTECSQNLISIAEASKLLDISLAKFRLLSTKYPNEIIEYPVRTRVKYYKPEILLLLEIQASEVVPEQIKWSHFFLKCKKCKSTDFPHVESGYCSQCYVPIQPKWSERYKSCTKCKTTKHKYMIAGLCKKCYEKSNYYFVPRYYSDGLTYQEIGEELGISKERVRQILKKVSQSSIAEKLEGEPKSISSLKNESKKKRIYDEWYPKIDKNYHRYLKAARGYYSISRFCNEQSIPRSARFIIEDNLPEIFELINARKERWSWGYDFCLMCKSTDLPYKANGYCEKCYPKSDVFKSIQKESYLKHRDDRLAYNREFSKEYYSRKDIKLKQQRKQDVLNYDGNREKALIRDNYQCVDCGVDRESNYQKHGVDFRVRHIDNNSKNNNLDNLRTLCSSCFSKNVWKSRHPKNNVS